MEDRICFFKKQQIRRYTSSIFDNVLIKSYERIRTSLSSVKETYITVFGVINNKVNVQALAVIILKNTSVACYQPINNDEI